MKQLHSILVISTLFLSTFPVRAQEQPDPMSLIRKAVENDKINDK